MQTDLTRLLGIEAPIVQGAFGPWTTAELSAAVSEAGGLGSIGTATLPPDRVRELAPRLLPDKGAEIIVYCSSPT